MSKQTFTTGQVLTAAQMTSLQQTAMGGGEATAKTASYVLVAADAGTTVIMNAAGATTITVNTALFAAGDTVNIQNIGAGICTVTAGTATVNTAGSLALNQYEGGVLYFRSTSASTFFDYVQTGSVSPLTTKGDLYGFSTLDARIPIGTNNQVLIADSAQALGLKWGSAPSASYTWTAWTPVLTQGVTVSTSTNACRYIQIGNLVVVKGNITASSAGTANEFIGISLPSTPINAAGSMASGVAKIRDASANLATVGVCDFYGLPDLSFGSGLSTAVTTWALTGANFAVALANNDNITFTAMYEVA